MSRLVVWVSVVAWVCGLSAVAAENGACQWANPEFYTAAPGRIGACIADGGLPEYRSVEGETALHIAAAKARDPRAVEALLRAGADPTLVQLDGRTPLHRAAAESSLLEVVSMLVLYGADGNRMFDKSSGWWGTYGTTPLHLAAARKDGAGMVAALLAVGADNGARTKRGRTALHRAVRLSENVAVIDLLLASGSDVDAEDEEGWRAIHFAASRCDGTEIIRRLLDVGADPDAESDIEVPQTALRVAAARATDPACFKLLVDVSEEPCARDSEGRSAADFARENEHLKGADVYWSLHDLCTKAE